MSERTTEFRDSDVVKNEPLVSDVEEGKKDKPLKSQILKFLIIIIISLIIIALIIFLILYLLKNNSKKDKEDIVETISITATYIVYNTLDKIKLFNENLLNSIHSIEVNGIKYKNKSIINFESEGENTIIINIKKGTENLEYMFEECGNLIDVNLTEINNVTIKSIAGMFFSCSSLISFDFNLNNPYIENMSNLFSYCVNLKEINVFKLSFFN